jgi:mercuric ion binding protein
MKALIILFSLIFSINIKAQSTITTTTLSVKGNCGECKERIENAADIKGVKICKWDEKTQVATITFDASKITVAKIEAAIAKSGHDTQSAEADDKSYKSLPDCCMYKNGDCKK